MKKVLVAAGILLTLGTGTLLPLENQAAPANTTQKKPAAKPAAKKTTPAKKPPEKKQETTGILDPSYLEIQPLSLLKEPETWIDKKISFEGNFVSFSPYALDYKNAMRESKDFISFLVQRPDVEHHVIPLSELKLIYPRKKADDVIDLESGDKVLVKGKVFSAALGDPWMDVDEVILLKKTPENEAKANAKKKEKKEDLD